MLQAAQHYLLPCRPSYLNYSNVRIRSQFPQFIAQALSAAVHQRPATTDEDAIQELRPLRAVRRGHRRR